MAKSSRVGVLVGRLAAVLALAAFLFLLPTVTSSSQSSCCSICLDRFYQCDGTTAVCCKLYASCVQQCQGGCPACPDQ
jgi:hypothetical protein